MSHGTSRGDALDFLAVAEFPGAAGGVDQIQMNIAGKTLRSPVFVESADVRTKGAMPVTVAEVDGFLAALEIQREAALGHLAQGPIAHLKFVEQRA